MKKIALLLAILMLLFVVSACDKVGDAPSATEAPTTPATSSPVETTAAIEGEEDDFFDAARSHLPTEEEILQVKQGMSFYAVVDLIGKPHRFSYSNASSANRLWTLVWETAEGNAYAVYFYPSDEISHKDIKSLSLEEYHRYTVARHAPQPTYTEPQS